MNNTDYVINLCKRRGFVYPNSSIYDGLKGFWDFGPLGVELKNNIIKMWWQDVVYRHKNIVGLDSNIILSSKVWKSSQHIDRFNDYFVDCKQCRKRIKVEENFNVSTFSCQYCNNNNCTDIRKFFGMISSNVGDSEGEQTFLRPETAQGIFVNYLNIIKTNSLKIPFGIAQVGKAFRNEITPGNFIYRIKEFEQMEVEFFVNPTTVDYWYKYWVDARYNWYIKIGINSDNLYLNNHKPDKLAHYAINTTDIEYKFYISDSKYSELEGISNRGSYDFLQHQNSANIDYSWSEENNNNKYIPYIIEPSVGVSRIFFALLLDSYTIETLDNGTKRHVLKINKYLSPVKLAVLPLVKNESLIAIANDIYSMLCIRFNVMYDIQSSIGKRYRKHDEIGTPLCLTIDFDTLKDSMITIRHRDSMKQDRVKIAELFDYINAYYIDY